MQNLSKIRSNSCIHRFILIILPHFVVNDHKFYPLYHHLKINLNPSHHSPNEQLSFSFDSTARDFNSLSTSSNSFSFPFPTFLWFFFFSFFLFFIFFFIRGRSFVAKSRAFYFLFIPRVFFSIHTLLLISHLSHSPNPRYEI